MAIELTDEQIELKKELRHWYTTLYKPYYYYSGAAGTGKTTVIKSFISDMGFSDSEIISAAYVGKAVLVLLRHGLRACTIHSLIYRPVFETIETQVPDEYGNIRIIKKRKVKFVLKERLDDDVKLIIIDEAAMVNDTIRADLLSFGIPIIMLGDHNQLPPVIGKSSILDKPDFILTKIMRQAEGDPIIYFSQCILKDIPIDYGVYGKSEVARSVSIDRRILDDYDIIICAKNKTRENINSEIRSGVLKIPGNEPIIGEKMICRQNNWDECINGIFLTNGLVGYITNVDYSMLYHNVILVDFQPDFMNESFSCIPLDYKYLRSSIDERRDFGISEYNKFEYAYAITAHLSQGSEYDRVLFIDEWFRDAELTKKMRYTAITRARDKITIVKHEPKRFYNVRWDNNSYRKVV